MPQIQTGLFGALAVGLTLGAVQFASGHDLIGTKAVGVQTVVSQSVVNRAAKADRAGVPAVAAKSRTVAFNLQGMPDSSVLVRIPMAVREEARSRPVAPAAAQPGEARKVACEPVVSVLTEVAKQLQPGRCVT